MRTHWDVVNIFFNLFGSSKNINLLVQILSKLTLLQIEKTEKGKNIRNF
jgi:hypothetical protein